MAAGVRSPPRTSRDSGARGGGGGRRAPQYARRFRCARAPPPPRRATPAADSGGRYALRTFRFRIYPAGPSPGGAGSGVPPAPTGRRRTRRNGEPAPETRTQKARPGGGRRRPCEASGERRSKRSSTPAPSPRRSREERRRRAGAYPRWAARPNKKRRRIRRGQDNRPDKIRFRAEPLLSAPKLSYFNQCPASFEYSSNAGLPSSLQASFSFRRAPKFPYSRRSSAKQIFLLMPQSKRHWGPGVSPGFRQCSAWKGKPSDQSYLR